MNSFLTKYKNNHYNAIISLLLLFNTSNIPQNAYFSPYEVLKGKGYSSVPYKL